MATFTLDDRVRTGVKRIDDAHELLLVGLGRMVDAVRGGTAYKHIDEFLDLFETELSEHFTEEEELMLSMSYPEYGDHLVDHEMLKDRLKQLHKKYRDSGYYPDLAVQVGNFMAGWMMDHLYGRDLRMVSWLRQQNQSHLMA